MGKWEGRSRSRRSISFGSRAMTIVEDRRGYYLTLTLTLLQSSLRFPLRRGREADMPNAGRGGCRSADPAPLLTSALSAQLYTLLLFFSSLFSHSSTRRSSYFHTSPTGSNFIWTGGLLLTSGVRGLFRKRIFSYFSALWTIATHPFYSNLLPLAFLWISYVLPHIKQLRNAHLFQWLF